MIPTTVTLRLFGPLAEQAGGARFEIPSHGGTVESVLAECLAALPSFRLDVPVRTALNGEWAQRSARVAPGDVLALIPPVGGG